jgi:hypothetical protein
MGLVKNKLGVRYEVLGYEIRTWYLDRRDYHYEHPDNNIVDERFECGRNDDDSNPNLILEVSENREWNPTLCNWQPDGRFTLDFIWPWNSDKKSIGENREECNVEPEDLKALADYIYEFSKDCKSSWGAETSIQTKSDNSLFEQNDFKIKYGINYFVYEEKKDQETIDFDFVIKKYKLGIEGFETFAINMPAFQMIKKIDQLTDIIMTPVQLKEFADFIYKSLGEELVNRIKGEST